MRYIECSREYALSHLERKPVYEAEDKSLVDIESAELIPAGCPTLIPIQLSELDVLEYNRLVESQREIEEKLNRIKAKFSEDADAAASTGDKSTYSMSFGNTLFYMKESNSMLIVNEEELAKLPIKDILDEIPAKVIVGKSWRLPISTMLEFGDIGYSSKDVVDEICKFKNCDSSISKKLRKDPTKNIDTLMNVLGMTRDEAETFAIKYNEGLWYDKCLLMAEQCNMTVPELIAVLKKNIVLTTKQSVAVTTVNS